MKSILTMLGIAAALLAAWSARAAIYDAIQFGEPGSEKSHGLESDDSEVIRGGLDEPARILLPRAPASWQGGSVKFKLRVNPNRQNYVTLKLWGGDVNENLLILHADGRQVGYRSRGDIGLLDYGSPEPAVPGRFYYVTLPLPMSATYRRERVEFEIVSTGRIWEPGRTFEQYQKKMLTPSRGLYRFYVHDHSYFKPPAEDRQGVRPEPVLPPPQPESFEALKERVNRELDRLLGPDGRFTNQMQLLMAAEAAGLEWSRACRNPEAVRRIVAGLDNCYLRWREDPSLASDDRSAVYPAWTGFGPAAEAVRLLHKDLGPYLDEELRGPDGQPVRRRKAWADMLEAGVRHLAASRSRHPKQSMIVDLNLYRNNRGLRLLDPSKGLPPEVVLGCLYESVGLEPWSGPLEGKGKPVLKSGGSDRLFTAKRLPKEFGYDGNDGELPALAAAIYQATRPEPGKPGDERILGVLREMIRARSFFRYPALNLAHNPVMRLETVIGWRDMQFPGDVTYVQRPESGASVLQAAAAALDPYSTGIVQQMFGERQFFPSLDRQMEDREFRTTFGLLHVPEHYRLLTAQPASSSRLPMSEGQPDFVFSDEESGVLAVKYGSEILYASLYWRAPHAVNFLARIHHVTPVLERLATVRQEVEFQPSGRIFVRPGRTNSGVGAGGLNYPDNVRSIHAGETLPIARLPKTAGTGQENPLAGRGDFYKLLYGPYLFAMNASSREFTFTTPKNIVYKRLPDGGEIAGGTVLKVAPMSTVVLRRAR